MKKSASGFTIVELLVVITVLVILTTITTLAYTNYQDKATTSSAKTMANLVARAAQQYYIKNGEYPSARDLAGSTSDGKSITTPTTAAQVLSLSIENLSTNNLRFTPCVNGSNFCTIDNNNDRSRVFYIARNAGDTSQRSVQIGSCSVGFPADSSATGAGTSAFVIAYFDPGDSDVWIIKKSDNGEIIKSADASSCTFQ